MTQEEPPRLRTLDPAIPRDLETIVHKAIEHDPAHRYADGRRAGRRPAAVPRGPADPRPATSADRSGLPLGAAQQGAGGVAGGRGLAARHLAVGSTIAASAYQTSGRVTSLRDRIRSCQPGLPGGVDGNIVGQGIARGLPDELHDRWEWR